MFLSVTRDQIQDQRQICIKNGALPNPPRHSDTLHIARKTVGMLPINGLRRPSKNGDCGWYIWCGYEPPEESEFFQEMELTPFLKKMPELEKFLALPPGYRFLLAGAHVEVWYDSGLLGT